jgi:molybdopterin synthase sulfur carrier subunit
VAILRLFASARDAAGTGRDVVAGATVDEVLGEARQRYGAGFAAVLDTAKVWINGEPAALTDRVGDDDEVAVLPPVSGGALGADPHAAGSAPASPALPASAATPATAAAPAKATAASAKPAKAKAGKPVKKAARPKAGKPVKKAAKRPPGTGATRAAEVAPEPTAPVRRRQTPPRRALKASKRRANAAGWVVRLFAEPNTDGPRVRVGLLWFALLLPAAYFGAAPTAALFGLVAGIAALQAGQSWRRAGYRPSRLVAAPFAVALPIAAVSSYSLPGVIVLALPLIALAAAFVVPRRRRRTTAFGAAGITILCALVPGLAATGMVYTARLGVGACIVFVLLISAYDVGSFLVGAEASSPSHGIIAGCLCVLVAMAPVFAFQLPPFDGESAAWIFGGMIAVFAPLGQIVGAFALPSGTTWVPALRRLDAYVLTAPLWAWSLWSYLG